MADAGGSNVVDEAVYRLVADTRGFVTSVQNAGKQAAGELKQVDTAAAQNTKSVNSLGQSFGKLVAVIGTMAAAYIGVSTIKSAISYTQEYGLAVAKLARETGMATEQASELIAVGHHMGIGADDLSRSFGILAKKLKGVQDEETGVTTGAMAASDILKSLGVTVTTTDGQLRPLAELIPEISAAFVKMPDGVAKTGLAMQLFGRSGKDMIPFLNLGPTAMKELAEEANKLGVVLGPENVQQIKNYTFAQRDMSEAMGGIKLMIGMELMPALTSLMQWFVDVQPKIRQFIGAAQDIGENVVSFLKPFAEQLGEAAYGLGIVIQALSQTTLGIVAMGTALGALLLRGTIASILALASGFLTMAEAEGVAEAATILLSGSMGPLVLAAAAIAAVGGLILISKQAKEHAEAAKEAKKAVDDYVQSLEDQAGEYAKMAGGDEMLARMEQDISTYGELGRATEEFGAKRQRLMDQWSAASLAGNWDLVKTLVPQINELDAALDLAGQHAGGAKERLQDMAKSGQITFQEMTSAVSHGNLTLSEAKEIWPEYAKWVEKGADANERAEVAVIDTTEAFKGQVDKVTKLTDKLKDYDSTLERITGQETAEEAALLGQSAQLNDVIKAYDARTAAGETLTSQEQAEYDAAVKGKDVTDAQIDSIKAHKEAVEKGIEAQVDGRPTVQAVTQDAKDQGAAFLNAANEAVIANAIENALVTDPLQQQIMRLTMKAGESAEAAQIMAKAYGDALNAAIAAEQAGGAPRHEIPYAEGGWTRQRRVLVGEKGPEIAELPVGTRIYSNAATRRIIAAASAPAMQGGGVVPYGPSATDQIMKWVAASLPLGPIGRWLAAATTFTHDPSKLQAYYAPRTINIAEQIVPGPTTPEDEDAGRIDPSGLSGLMIHELLHEFMSLLKAPEQVRSFARLAASGLPLTYTSQQDLERVKGYEAVGDDQHALIAALHGANGHLSQIPLLLQSFFGGFLQFHEGGIVPGRAGQTVAGWLEPGERVLTAQQATASNQFSIPISITAEGSDFDDVVRAAHEAVEAALQGSRARWYRAGASLSGSIG
jgi:molecular chaperone GrpE (heat shock protein)